MMTDTAISPTQALAEKLGDAPARLEVSNAARAAFTNLDFPTTRVESWKYTRVSRIVKQAYQRPTFSGQLAQPWTISDLDAVRLVFVNGQFQADLSTMQQGVDAMPLSQAMSTHGDLIREKLGWADSENEVFTALNTGWMDDGAFILVEADTSIVKPIHVVHLTDGDTALCQPRNLIVAERGARATIIFQYGSNSGENAFANAVTEIEVAENADLDTYLLQEENDTAFHIGTTQVKQARDSRFSIVTLTTGGNIVRNNLNISVDGTNCDTHLHGLYITNGKQHVDNHTVVDHREPHCESNEQYKGVLADKSTGVFNGKVFVRQDAQKTNAFQSNQNILLSDDADMNSKPELEIYADDVKCSHGSTTGQFDEEGVFYLRSRGINEAEARKLMVHAFAADVTEHIKSEPVRNYVADLVSRQFD